MKITKEMSILEVLKKYPAAREIFSKYDLACSDCLGAVSEKIKDVANSHEIDIGKLVDDLNEIADKKED
jgi:hybrid cluster-associated redox disulfide protein